MNTRLWWVRGGLVTAALVVWSSHPARAAFTIGPNLHKVTPNSITITFETSVATTSTVEYGTTVGVYPNTVSEATSTTWHERTLSALIPGTTYYYRIRCGDGTSIGDNDATYHFLPTPAAGDSFTFLAYGDSRTFPANHASVITAMLARCPEARFLVTVGDYTTDGRVLSYWLPQLFDVIKPVSRSMPFYAVLGNHEFNSSNYYNLLALPTNGNGSAEQYYSFDYLNCHFVNLYVPDTGNTACNVGTPQHSWLTSDLAGNQDKQHRFVLLHSPPYSSGGSGRHGSDTNLQTQIAGVLQTNHVDALFAGHDHDYERSYPLTNGSRDDTSGVVYFVTGAGGAPLYPFTTQAAWSAFQDGQNYSFTKVEVQGTSVIYSQIAASGVVLDTFGTDDATAFRFGWAGDTHFGLNSYAGETLTPGTWLQQSLASLESQQARFLFHGGDAVETPTTTSQWDAFDAAMKPTMPWYGIAGEHDLGNPPASLTPVNAWINRHYGVGTKGYYGFVYKNAAFYVLDTVSQQSADSTVRQRFADQIAAMNAFFTANEIVPVKIVCGHVPLFNQTRDEADSPTNIAATYRDQVLQAMDAHQAHYYLAGHSHAEDAVTDGGITVYTQTSLSYLPGGEIPQSCYLFTVTDSDVQREAIRIGPPLSAKSFWMAY